MCACWPNRSTSASTSSGDHLGPALRPEDLEAERQVILEEILMHGDEPAEEVHDIFNSAMYPGHPLGRDVLGLEATVSAAHATRSPGSTASTTARPTSWSPPRGWSSTPPSSTAWCPGWTRRPPPSGGRRCWAAAGPNGGPRRPRPGPAWSCTRPTEQAHVMVGMPGFDRNHPDRQVLNVLDHILGGGMSSRLFQSIREERGLAYSVYSYRSGYQGTGDFAVYAGTAPAKAPEVLKLITEELDKMAATGPAEDELKAARSHIRGATALGLEDSGARMSRLGRSQLAHGQGAVPGRAGRADRRRDR